jgi:GAF domain-containing protein
MTANHDKGRDVSYVQALQEMTHLYERLVEELSILLKLDHLDDPALSFDTICRRLVETIAFGLRAQNCTLMLPEEEGQVLRVRAACSPYEEQAISFVGDKAREHVFGVGEGLAGVAYETGQSIRLDDATQDSRFVARSGSPFAVRSLMCFPMFVGTRGVGVLNLSHSEPGFFKLEDQNTLALVAQRAARLLSSNAFYRGLTGLRTSVEDATAGAGGALSDLRATLGAALREDGEGVPREAIEAAMQRARSAEAALIELEARVAATVRELGLPED